MFSESDDRSESASGSHVVLIHGLGGHRLVLWPLARHLKNSGFTTSTFGYPSCWWSIEHHAERFRRQLTKLNQDPRIRKLHIVAHSMGSIVTRQAILESRFEKLDRIVMLASPNQGSPVAGFFWNCSSFLQNASSDIEPGK